LPPRNQPSSRPKLEIWPPFSQGEKVLIQLLQTVIKPSLFLWLQTL